jgi:outer membrane protein assembly factor BamE (lipoprotein component of BamABCDE complex)
VSRPVVRLLAALAVSALASGCFSFSGSFGAPIPREHLERIEPGRTTRAEITAWFGPPSAFARPGLLDLILANDGSDQAPTLVIEDVYSYRYIESRVRVTAIPIVMLRARAVTQSEALTVFFDAEGVVRYYGYRLDAPDTIIGAVRDE